jgi:hypothetical protein
MPISAAGSPSNKLTSESGRPSCQLAEELERDGNIDKVKENAEMKILQYNSKGIRNIIREVIQIPCRLIYIKL